MPSCRERRSRRRRRSAGRCAAEARATAVTGTKESFGHAAKTPSEPLYRMNAILPSEADLQLLFARLNYQYFNGEVPDCRIALQRALFELGRADRLRRTQPMTIELSPKHFRKYPEALDETLLHEMVHAWCFARFRDMRPRRAFQEKTARVRHRLDLSRAWQRARRCASRANATSCAANTAPSKCCARSGREAGELPALQQRVASIRAIRSRSTKSSRLRPIGETVWA